MERIYNSKFDQSNDSILATRRLFIHKQQIKMYFINRLISFGTINYVLENQLWKTFQYKRVRKRIDTDWDYDTM